MYVSDKDNRVCRFYKMTLAAMFFLRRYYSIRVFIYTLAEISI